MASPSKPHVSSTEPNSGSNDEEESNLLIRRLEQTVERLQERTPSDPAWQTSSGSSTNDCKNESTQNKFLELTYPTYSGRQSDTKVATDFVSTSGKRTIKMSDSHLTERSSGQSEQAQSAGEDLQSRRAAQVKEIERRNAYKRLHVKEDPRLGLHVKVTGSNMDANCMVLSGWKNGGSQWW